MPGSTAELPERKRKPQALVFGAGFGLYGHAIAIKESGWDVSLPKKYRDIVYSRDDLYQLRNSKFINCDDTDSLVVQDFDLCCLARRLGDNALLLKSLIESGYKGKIVIEKPLSTNPDAALDLLMNVIRPWQQDPRLTSANVCAIPYLFEWLSWHRLLLALLQRDRFITLRWYHRPGKKLASWKSEPREGGGDISYYAIHLIALYHQFSARGIKFPKPVISRCGPVWQLDAENLSMEFSADLDSQFAILDGDSVVVNMKTPFGEVPRSGLRDPRIAPLNKFYRSLSIVACGTQIYIDICRTWKQAIQTEVISP